FLGNPRERAPISDPGGTVSARPLRRHGTAFRRMNDVGSRDLIAFEARWHGPLTRCLRFAVPVTRAPRKTRFRPLAKLCRAGVGAPQGSIDRFPRYIASPSPKLSWRTHSDVLPGPDHQVCGRSFARSFPGDHLRPDGLEAEQAEVAGE